jgi:hypothetical protein
MLKKSCTELIDKNKFVIHFIDKENERITPVQLDKIHNYETVDDSKYRMGLRNTAMPKSILIDIIIEYPTNIYYPNFYELIDINEKRFQDFYNEIMSYNQTMDYKAGIKSEVLDSESK